MDENEISRIIIEAAIVVHNNHKRLEFKTQGGEE